MDKETLMKEIALSHPAAARFLDNLPLNYCCNGGGKISLAEACANAGLDAETVLVQLQQAVAQPKTEPQWNPDSTASLVRHIVDTHHRFTRSEMTRLDSLVNKIITRHGETRPELEAIGACFRALRDDLMPHLIKEEKVLFPYIEALEKHHLDGEPLPPACFGSIDNPLRQMIGEHDEVMELLQHMRQLTNGYAPPAEACPSYRTTLQALQELEADLLQHIRLENDVLFPKARSLAEGAD